MLWPLWPLGCDLYIFCHPTVDATPVSRLRVSLSVFMLCGCCSGLLNIAQAPHWVWRRLVQRLHISGQQRVSQGPRAAYVLFSAWTLMHLREPLRLQLKSHMLTFIHAFNGIRPHCGLTLWCDSCWDHYTSALYWFLASRKVKYRTHHWERQGYFAMYCCLQSHPSII